MIESKGRRNGVRLAALSVLGLTGCLSAHQAYAGNGYFDTNGTTSGYGITTGSTYSWDAANWATASGGTSATSNWVPGSFAEFPGGGTGVSYTVTVGADELMAGMYQNSAGTLTINQASGTSGDLDIASGLQGFLGDGSGNTVIINAPIVGSGGLEPEVSNSTFYLNGNNTYSGGTTLYYSSVLTYFNNGNAFGTGTINVGISSTTGYAPLLATAGTTVTIPNNWVVTEGGVNFAANANTPVVTTGTWSLGSTNPNLLRNNGTSSSPLTLANSITGAGSLVLSGANGGTITFKGANTFTGTTTVGASGATNFSLILGTANSLATNSGIVLAGGTLNPDGFNQSMTGTTLGLTATSTIDFGAGASELDFANSAGLSWTGTALNLVNFNSAVDLLRFGTGNTGLTATQLAKITFNGAGAGTAMLDANGFLVEPSAAAPEPAMLLPLLGAGLVMVGRRRVRK